LRKIIGFVGELICLLVADFKKISSCNLLMELSYKSEKRIIFLELL
jgi:hypothetical protein